MSERERDVVEGTKAACMRWRRSMPYFSNRLSLPKGRCQQQLLVSKGSTSPTLLPPPHVRMLKKSGVKKLNALTVDLLRRQHVRVHALVYMTRSKSHSASLVPAAIPRYISKRASGVVEASTSHVK